jgi:hypothetical protein
MELERVSDAAATTLGMYASDALLREIKDAAAIVGATLEREIRSGERVSFFVPAFLIVDGKSRPGAILLAEERILFGYAEGAMRLKETHLQSIPYAQIRRIRREDRKIGMLAPKKPAMIIEGDRASIVVVFNADGTPDGLINLVNGVLEGWAKPQWSDGETSGDPN